MFTRKFSYRASVVFGLLAASCNGAGSISVYASERLDASVSGIGSIDYSGNPATVNRSVSGLGKISQK